MNPWPVQITVLAEQVQPYGHEYAHPTMNITIPANRLKKGGIAGLGELSEDDQIDPIRGGSENNNFKNDTISKILMKLKNESKIV